MGDFTNFFRKATKTLEIPAGFEPRSWQRELGEDNELRDRLLRIPTGFGKTAGVVIAWLYHRESRGDDTWPTRLAIALPMRVLVEQTARSIESWLSASELSERVGLHVLMGGADAGEFHFLPERPAILVGTQDMMISRALNRGYGAARGRWPIDFGLLHSDVLWVFDEIQLMDVGLATSTQLAAMRQARKRDALRPSATWWMSATLQPGWLETVDLEPEVPRLRESMLQIPPSARSGGLWDVEKALDRRADCTTPEEVAQLVDQERRAGKLTLVILNTVDRALSTFDALRKKHAAAGKLAKSKTTSSAGATTRPPAELRLIHSRFRGHEREAWSAEFLRRDADVPTEGRIIVATQVVEAGVDISADLLVTDLAPWPSLVQRFGRAARYEGEAGRVIVASTPPRDEKKALPYSLAELESAADALARLQQAGGDAGPRSLERFEDRLAEEDPALLERLYPYDPLHVLRQVDLDDLFDTSADLSGADLDVSRFIRSGEERDVALFWRAVESTETLGPDTERPRRAELCAAPVAAVKKWLTSKADRQAWLFSYLENNWERVKDPNRQIYPGVQILLAGAMGGYDSVRGFDPGAKKHVQPVAPPDLSPQQSDRAAWLDHFERAAAGELEDMLSVTEWKTIATHGREAGGEAAAIARSLGLGADLVEALEIAGWWHDLGKSHEAFQAAISESAREHAGATGERKDLAKAPPTAWTRGYPSRPGFRHELASFLALYEHLARAAQGESQPHPALFRLAELLETRPEWVDLVAWLVLSHHGKVRCRIVGTPNDQKQVADSAENGPRLHGVCANDVLPEVPFLDPQGSTQDLSGVALSLQLAELGLSDRYGASWTERVTRLLDTWGPFTLAYLESILRAADVRASRLATEDPLL